MLMVQYRKSKKAGPFRFTVSQRGISTSVGAGPLRITYGADGRVRRTVRAPGLGLYDTKVIGGKRLAPKPARPVSKTEARFMAAYLVAAALLVVAIVEVLALALFATGHCLIGIFVAAPPILFTLWVIGKTAEAKSK